MTEAVETADYSHPARGFVTGNPTLIEVQESATVSVDDIIMAAETALKTELGPTPAKLTFQEIVYLAQKPGAPGSGPF